MNRNAFFPFLKQFLFTVIKTIVFTNTWISLGALSVYLFLTAILQVATDMNNELSIWSSTFIAYNVLKLNGLRHESNQSIFFRWLRKWKVLTIMLLFLVGSIFFFTFFKLQLKQQIVYLISGVVALLYLGINEYNLRKFILIKIPIIGFVWSFLLVFSIEESTFSWSYILPFFCVYFLIVGLTIPFEIRDYNTDRMAKNTAVLLDKININQLKYLAVAHLLLSGIFLLFINANLFVYLVLPLMSILIISKLNLRSGECYYTFLLDGVLVLLYPFYILLNGI